MSSDLGDLRQQILANAKYMMFSAVKTETPSDNGPKLPALSSVATLVAPSSASTGTGTGRTGIDQESLEVVVYGDGNQFTAAVMCGIHPVIEGSSSAAPEGAMRRLFLSTAELLSTIMPKLGSHQRNIHGGGVVDEDFLSRDLLDKKV